MDIRSVVSENRVLAIMRNVPFEKTLDYAEMTVNGGISFFEVALNSGRALEQISLLREKMGDQCIIGAGTAITVEKADAAVKAGAQFLLTPGTPEDVLVFCAERKIPLLPGVMTPSDVAVCLKYGFDTMKLFPVGSMPQRYVRDLKGPFDNTEYVAIGGVDRNNITDFLGQGYLGAGLASALVPKDIVREGRWAEGSEMIRTLVEKVRAWQEGAQE